jgi:hypothetical protein
MMRKESRYIDSVGSPYTEIFDVSLSACKILLGYYLNLW